MFCNCFKIWLVFVILLAGGQKQLCGQVRTGLMFSGGANEGSAKSCIVPVIKAYGDTLITCVDTVFQLNILAEGTDLEYVWQKKSGVSFVNISSNDGGRIEGFETNILTVKKPDKLKDDGIYRCVVMNDCGAIYSIEMVVNLDFIPKIISGLNGPSYKCVGEQPEKLAIIVPPGSAYNYSWYKIDEDGFKRPYDPNNKLYNNPYLEVYFANREAQGHYVVDITNQCGTISDTAYLRVYAPVVIELTNINTNREVMGCIKENANFSVRLSGGGSYNYSLKAIDLTSYAPLHYNVKKTIGNNKPEIVIPNLESADNGYYIWEAKNECGVDTSELIHLFIDSLPRFINTSPDTEVCEGDKLVLSVMALAKKPITYTWYHNGISTGKTGSTLIIDPMPVDGGGVYTCYANNGCQANSICRPIKVTVKNKPYIMKDPYLTRPTCEGDTLIVMTTAFSSIPIDSMRWYKDFKAIQDIPNKIIGAKTPALGIFDVADTDQSIYFIRAYNECGYTESQKLDLKLKRKPTIVRDFKGNADLVLCDASDQTLSVEVMGDEAIRYIWLHDQRVVADGYTGKLAVSGGVIDTANIYCVHVQNMCGEDIVCAKLRVAKIHPYDVKVEDENPCAGYGLNNRVIISNTDTNIVYTLYKKPGNTIISRFPGHNAPDTILNLDRGTYYMTGLDTNGCERKMNGEAILQYLDSPNEYPLYIAKQKCQGSAGAVLALGGSDENEKIIYTLYRQLGGKDKSWYAVPGSEKRGTGYELNWEKIDYGRYKVVAMHLLSGCKREMILLDTVEIKPLPQLFHFHSDGKTGYCLSEESRISLILDGYEAACRYTLKRNGSQYLASLNRSPIKWANVESGQYVVTIQNQWCEVETPLVEIVGVPDPQRLPVTGGGIFCDFDTTGAGQSEINLANTEVGIRYECYRVQDNKLLAKYTGNGKTFKVMIPPNEGYSYRIYATEPTGNCRIGLNDIEVKYSNFQAVTDPRTIFINRYATTSLHVNIEGAYKSPLSIQWSGPHLLPIFGFNPDQFADRGTFPIPDDEDYTVTATDANGCVKSDIVKVRMISQPLLCEIRNAAWWYNTPTCYPPGCVINKWNIEKCTYEKMMCCIGKTKSPVVVPKYTRMAYCAAVLGGGDTYDRYLKFIPDDLISKEIVWGNQEQTNTWEALESGTLYLTVTSGLETARDSIRILVTENPLKVELRDDLDGRADTMKVCNGDLINLYSWVSGGNQPAYAHKYLWSGDGYPANSLGSHPHLTDFKATHNGTIRLQVSNDGETQWDSTYIKIIQSPTLYTLSGQDIKHEDIRFVHSGVKEIITLSDSDPGTKYVLEFAPKSTSVYGDYGLSQRGSGEAISFPILHPEHFEGTFRIRAEIQDGVKICSATMEGTVVMCIYRDLVVEIRDSFTDIDTLRICKGDPLLLNSEISGGNGPITNIGWYFEGTTIGTNRVLKDYIPLYSGKMILTATSADVKKNDTVYVKLLDTPTELDIDNPGAYVVYTDDAKNISMSNTEVGVKYYLQFARDGKTYFDLLGPENGGGIVNFIVEQPLRYLGTFRIRAEQGDEDACPCIMRGTVVYYYYDPNPNNPGGGDSGGGDNPGGGGSGGGDNPGGGGSGGGDNPGGGGSGGGDNPGGIPDGNPGGGPGGDGSGGGVVPPDLPDRPGTVTTPMLDSIWLCEDDELYVFTSWALGYDKKVSWFTKKDKLSSTLTVSWHPKKSEFLYLEKSGELGKTRDSMYVTVIPKPKKYSIVGKVSHCVATLSKDTIRLEKSEPGVEYILEYSKDGKTYLPFGRGTKLNGWGGELKFIVEQPALYEGYFIIRAIRNVGDRFCETYMAGMVEMILNPNPTVAESVYFYCKGTGGAEIKLENVMPFERYSIYKNNILLESIKSPTQVFKLKYTQGNYMLRADKLGYYGTCSIVNIPLGVVRSEIPEDSMHVVTHGVQCEGELTTVEIKSTQPSIYYTLVGPDRNDTVAMLIGNGLDQKFTSFITKTGTYRISASNKHGCTSYLTPVVMHKIPKDIWIDTCSYCYEYNETLNSKTCELNVKKLEKGIKYILYNGQQAQGFVFGPGKYTFKNLTGGKYYRVDAVDTISGCVATVAKTRVDASEKPCPIPVKMKCGVKQSVVMDASESDVTYYLFRNEVRLQDSLIGNGAALDFGIQDTAGIYTVYGKRDTSDYCLTQMPGNVAIYNLADTARIYAEGKACSGSGGVELIFPCSSRGWKYYIQIGTRLSDRVDGNGDTIVFSRINNTMLRGGKYYLYAENECTTVLLDSIEVVEFLSPRVYRVMPTVASFCPNQGIEIKISGSEKDILYIGIDELMPNKVQPIISNTGTGLPGPLSVGVIHKGGSYQIYGIDTVSGCESYMGRTRLSERDMPIIFNILGRDTCLTSANATMEICLPNKQLDVTYDLYCESNKLSTLSKTDPAAMCFPEQTGVGCYRVTAQHTSGCRDTLEGVYCLGDFPVRYGFDKNIFKKENGQWVLYACEGDQVSLSLNGSQKGVKYILVKDGVDYGIPVIGTGVKLRVGDPRESGKYWVRAFNGCSEMMNDTVNVKFIKAPEIKTQQDLKYCLSEKGAQIVIENALANRTYILYEGTVADSKKQLDTRTTTIDGSIQYNFYPGPQKYFVQLLDHTTGCYNSAIVDITPVNNPQKVKFRPVNGSFICAGNCCELKVSSSEPMVEYILKETISNMEGDVYWGTGSPLTLRACDEGIYRVVATMLDYPYCSSESDDNVEIKSGVDLKVFEITGENTSYCLSNPNAKKTKITMWGSEMNVDYELYRDNIATGEKRNATIPGENLIWEDVAAKSCELGKAGFQGSEFVVIARERRTLCSKAMNGVVRAIAVEQPIIEAFYPTSDLDQCEWEPVNFNIVADGCDLKYTWQRGDDILLNETLPYLQMTAVDQREAGFYSCTVSNACGDISTNAILLKIRPSVKFDTLPMSDARLCDGVSGVLTSTMINAAEGDYIWYKRGYEGDTLSRNRFLEFSPARMDDAGDYVCIAKNFCGELRDTCRLDIDQSLDSLGLVSVADTVCVGTSNYTISLKTTYPVEWYKDGVPTGNTSHSYVIPKVSQTNAGVYSARIANSCETGLFTIRRLWVDDTIKIIDITPDAILCGGQTIDLFVNTVPWERVTYKWYEGSDYISSGKSIKHILQEGTPQRTIFVYYSNSCYPKLRAGVNISLNGQISFIDPPREILLCAESTPKDTCLIADALNTHVTSYKWHYNQKEGDQIIKDSIVGKESKYCFKAVPSNTGFYYCEMETTCGKLTSQTSWVVIDSLPVVDKLPEKDTVCEGAFLNCSLKGAGGSLFYYWQKMDKWRNIDTIWIDRGLDYHYISQLNYGPITFNDDSSKVWCDLVNHCGIVNSDTMLLLVTPKRELEINTVDTTICAGAEVAIILKLQKGMAPWTYSYQHNGGKIIDRTVKFMEDTLVLTEKGTYKVTKMRDAVQCEYKEDLLTFTINHREIPDVEIKVIGKDTICLGEQLKIEVNIVNGIGPWEVEIFRKSDGKFADGLDITNPLLLTEKERVYNLSFYPDKTDTLYISAIRDLNNSVAVCPGNKKGEAGYVVAERDQVKFGGPVLDSLGKCKVWHLQDLLKPSIPGGTWWIDGTESSNDLFSGQSSGWHKIEYITKNGMGCDGKQTTKLYVDSLPDVNILPKDTNICLNGTAHLKFELTGTPPFVLSYQVARIKWDGTKKTGDMVLTDKPPLKGQTFTLDIPYTKDDSACIVYAYSVKDRYGCVQKPTLNAKSIVYFRQSPDYVVYGKNRVTAWSNIDPYYILRSKDTVWFKVELLNGMKPWTLITQRWDSPSTGAPFLTQNVKISQDTTLYTVLDGTYSFQVKDLYCLESERNQDKRVVYLDTGYIKAKLLLEGAMKADNSEMDSQIKQFLPLWKGLKALPVTDKPIIDWVILKFIDAKDTMRLLAQDTFLLKSNGMLITVEGDTILPIPDVGDQDCFVVAEHRNHLSVMSREKVRMWINKLIVMNDPILDFTKWENIYSMDKVAEKHMTQVGTSWALSAGDLLLNSLLSIADPNNVMAALKNEVQISLGGLRGYYIRDVNFDGIADWASFVSPGNKPLTTHQDDKIIYKNRFKFSEIPLSAMKK